MVNEQAVRVLAGIGLSLFAIGLVAASAILQSADWLPAVDSEAGQSLLKNYNTTSHLLFLLLLSLSCGWLLRMAATHRRDHAQGGSTEPSLWAKLIVAPQRHPIVTALFAGYSVAMVRQASWFYKEIIGWYKDIVGGHLLDNFSLRWGFVTETMFRNDFRFFPLAHQDLHLLSWFTPYVNVWMLVNAAELFTIVVIGAKTAERLGCKVKQPATVLAFSILFLFDAATGFTFFQFIYSERIVVLLLSLFCFYYTRFFQNSQTSDQYLCLLTALLGLFFKDTGFLLFTVPAFTVLIAGCMGLVDGRPQPRRAAIREWLQAYELELCLCGLTLVLAVCFFYLSYLPSLYAGVEAYDSHLRWSRFEPDLRLTVLALTVLVRTVQIFRGKLVFSSLDAFNVGGITYALGLFAMVGFRSSNYMALPVQFASTLNLVVVANWFIGWMHNRGVNMRTLGVGTVVGCSALIGLEHLERQNFAHRITKMQIAQDSWVKTLDRMDQISRQALMDGEEINIIYSKSWFRNRGHLERLRFNRLIYYDIDLQTYTVVDGTNKGSAYKPQPGDFLLNIDTGKRLKNSSIDMAPYDKIWDYDDRESNGKIYRRRQPMQNE